MDRYIQVGGKQIKIGEWIEIDGEMMFVPVKG
jgi:hypothetical protein